MRNINRIITTFAIIICLASCGGNSADKARIAYLEEQIAELKNGKTENFENSDSRTEDFSQSSTSQRRVGSRKFVGTYKVVDEYNTTYTIVLNRDETVTVTQEGSAEIIYGSWSEFPYDVPCLNFSFRDYPYMEFPSGRENIDYGIITEEYLYSSNTNYKAKNPKFRLPIKKIK